MSATRMQTRAGKTGVAEWTGLFPNELKTEQESLVFVKRMMAVAVSSITYLRGIFPEEAYRSRYLEDVCIKVLREDCRTPGASKIVKWMMGCFDALEKHYLQIVFIGVYTNPDEPDRILESYQFKFKYTAKGPQMDILTNIGMEKQMTIENTKKASVLLIRKLFLLMQNLNTLPNNIYLSMRLYYYDEVTPVDYHPPGFKEGASDNIWFEGPAVHFKVGDVQTAFHALRVRVSAEQEHLEKLIESSTHEETNALPGKFSECKKVTKPLETKRYADGELPSEGESAQFKQPKKAVAKPLETKRYADGELPSEGESAQFKQPKKAVAKKNITAKKTMRKKRRI